MSKDVIRILIGAKDLSWFSITASAVTNGTFKCPYTSGLFLLLMPEMASPQIVQDDRSTSKQFAAVS